ncbi:FAD/NAD(P)-binding domain-containing protein [Rhizodiscina lignyota]|uniref:FAD/NAD(P)-binding domain-containing protein n=1 Tax=Rhizodiscina lignyota TaxID=1504668 RepID=A0A9P4INN3_9PEZI|nr:FAD/NAD(P)-binding domain-containing protein [Rhizodiscina lignyota]
MTESQRTGIAAKCGVYRHPSTEQEVVRLACDVPRDVHNNPALPTDSSSGVERRAAHFHYDDQRKSEAFTDLDSVHPDPSPIAIIDRTPFPPQHAASTDCNKIIRADYSSPFYMELAYEAMEAWNSWPELKQYYHRTGWINIRKRGTDLAERIRENFRKRGHDPTETLSLDETRRRFGGVFKDSALDDCGYTYWNPEAGWCDAGRATAELTKAAVDNGVRYVVGDVKKLRLGSTGVESVETQDGAVYTADKVLLATGAWTSSILTNTEDELGIEESDRVENQVIAAGVCVLHFKLDQTELEEMKDVPVVIYSEDGDMQPPTGENILKLTWAESFTNFLQTPSGSRISVPASLDQHVVPKKLQNDVRRFHADRLLPQYAHREVDYWRICWDAITPAQDHLITRHPHPRLSNLFLAVGGSFHSYKFLPIIGKYIINVLDGRSNGEEKDAHWAWKTGKLQGNGAHEKAYPRREFDDFLTVGEHRL